MFLISVMFWGKGRKWLLIDQCVRKEYGVNLSIIQTMSKESINSDTKENIYEPLDFDDMYIKARMGWDIN